MKISLIVNTYNSLDKLKVVLDAVEAGKEAPYEIIVSDDGSADETKQWVDAFREKSRCAVHHSWHEDKGFRKNKILNQSIGMATGDYIVFLDGDCVPTSSFIADHRSLAEEGYFVQGRRAFIKEDAVDLFLKGKRSLLQLFLAGKLERALKVIRLPRPIIKINQEHYGLLGCNLAIWRSDLIAVNGLDEAYEGWGIGEDSDLCIRLYNMGRRRKFVYGRCPVIHLNHPEMPKEHVEASLQMLQRTIDEKRVRCDLGIERS